MYSLREIEKDVAAALEREIPLTQADINNAKIASVQRVAGITLYNAEREKTFINGVHAQRVSRTQNYAADREKAIRRLQDRGVTPMAVLPTAAWKAICRNAGLYRLAPNDDGIVTVGTDKTITNIADSCRALSWAGAAIATVVCGGVALFAREPWVFTGMPVAFIGALLGTHEVCVAWCRRLRFLFPQGECGNYGHWHVRIELPEPPAEVAAVLAKVATLPVAVAVHPSAVRVSHDDLRNLIKASRTNLSDPIVYLREGQAVAVIAQYGDFGIERDAVEKAIDAGMVI